MRGQVAENRTSEQAIQICTRPANSAKTHRESITTKEHAR